MQCAYLFIFCIFYTISYKLHISEKYAYLFICCRFLQVCGKIVSTSNVLIPTGTFF